MVTGTHSVILKQFGEKSTHMKDKKKILLSVWLASAMLFCCYADTCAEINQALIAYYPFTDTADDASGNQNHGTVCGATLTSDRYGNPESAFRFDGNDDCIIIPHENCLNIRDEFTVSLFAKAADDNGFNSDNRYVQTTLLSKDGIGDDPDGPYNLYMTRLLSASEKDSTHEVWFEIQNNATEFYEPEGTYTWPTVSANEYHHIIWRHTANVYEIWIDGNLRLQLHSGQEPESGSTNLLIGRRGLMDSFFKGIIDEVRIYNRAISEAEIQLLYEDKQSQVPCVLTNTLHNEEQLHTLRTFRNALMKNAYGATLATLYYRHSEETGMVLDQNPNLKNRMIAFISNHYLLAADLASGRGLTISGPVRSEAVDLLHELQLRSGPELGNALDFVINGITNIHLISPEGASPDQRSKDN